MIEVDPGVSDVSVGVFIQDATATDGTGLTGLTKASSDLTCYYYRPGGSATALALSDISPSDAHMDGGFAEVDDANMPGVYRLDLPDAAVAAGVPAVFVYLKGPSNMMPCPETVILRKREALTSDLETVQSDVALIQSDLNLGSLATIVSDLGVIQSDLTWIGSDTLSGTSDLLIDASDILAVLDSLVGQYISLRRTVNMPRIAGPST